MARRKDSTKSKSFWSLLTKPSAPPESERASESDSRKKKKNGGSGSSKKEGVLTGSKRSKRSQRDQSNSSKRSARSSKSTNKPNIEKQKKKAKTNTGILIAPPSMLAAGPSKRSPQQVKKQENVDDDEQCFRANKDAVSPADTPKSSAAQSPVDPAYDAVRIAKLRAKRPEPKNVRKSQKEDRDNGSSRKEGALDGSKRSAKSKRSQHDQANTSKKFTRSSKSASSHRKRSPEAVKLPEKEGAKGSARQKRPRSHEPMLPHEKAPKVRPVQAPDDSSKKHREKQKKKSKTNTAIVIAPPPVLPAAATPKRSPSSNKENKNHAAKPNPLPEKEEKSNANQQTPPIKVKKHYFPTDDDSDEDEQSFHASQMLNELQKNEDGVPVDESHKEGKMRGDVTATPKPPIDAVAEAARVAKLRANRPEPRQIQKNQKQEKISKGILVKGRHDYPTMGDVMSDWESYEEKDAGSTPDKKNPL